MRYLGQQGFMGLFWRGSSFFFMALHLGVSIVLADLFFLLIVG
jgi:hypothetical protein